MAWNEPNRFNDGSLYNKSLEQAEKSLSKLREEREDSLQKLKESHLRSYLEKSKKGSEELKNLDLNLAKATNDYKLELLKKYADKYTDDSKKNAELDKKLALELLDFIVIEKNKRRAQETIAEMQRVQDVKNAELKADLEIAKKKVDLIKEQYNLNKEDIANRKKAALSEYQQGKKTRKEYKADMKKIREDEKKAKKQTAADMREAGQTELDIMRETGQLSAAGVKEAVFSKDTANEVANRFVNGLKQMFDSTIQKYGEYQTKVNARIQGSGRSWQGNAGLGLITLGGKTGGIEANIKEAVGSNAYVKLQAVMDNVVKATEQGIAYNIEQRAFLNTIKDSIATTFDAFDSNLTRIIRMQQSDSTAARLGLEAGLTNFFNRMYQDSAYLNSAFDTVSQNLIETTSQLTASQAVEFEYVVQKWLGSLYSVGFSESAVGKISEALGALGSGNVSSLSGNTEMQNLLVMAASRANLSYADMLKDGLDASKTNKLMKAMVQYLEEIAESDNKVVKSEYARIFGMTVSDLKAVSNVAVDLKDISANVMSYSSAVGELYSQMSELNERISVAGRLQNMFENVQYTVGTGIASNPVTYALWQITSMIEDLTGGINLPTVSVLGSFVDLNTTLTNLMRTGIVGISTLGEMGNIISGIQSSFDPSSMLSKLGIARGKQPQLLSRGTGLSRRSSQLRQQSASAFVGNTEGEDYYKESLTSAEDKKTQLAEQAAEEAIDVSVSNIHEYLLRVFDPKVTEIEKLVALLAGYQVKENTWTNSFYGHQFGDKDKAYTATTTVVVGLGSSSSNKPTSTDLLSDIKVINNDILNLLKNGELKVKVNDSTPIKTQGINETVGFGGVS